jgi:hypothetical protein
MQVKNALESKNRTMLRENGFFHATIRANCKEGL